MTKNKEVDVVETAFIILCNKDGSIKASADLAISFETSRDANIGDMRRASAELVNQINCNQAAAIAADNVLGVLRSMAEEAQNPKTASGLVVP